MIEMEPLANNAPRLVRPLHPTRIVVAITDESLRSRVILALRGASDAIEATPFCGEDRLLRGTVGERVLAVIGLHTQTGLITDAAIEKLRLREPLAQIVMCLARADVRTVDLASLARAGIDSFVLLDGVDRDGDLRKEVTDRLKHTLPYAVGKLDERCAPSGGVDLGAWCARNAYRPLHVRLVAHHFGVSRRTLYRAAKHAGWESTQVLLRSARLLHVAAAFHRGLTTAEAVSRHLRFGSAAALHKFVNRSTGGTVVQLREAGAIRVAQAVWSSRGRL